MSHPSVKWILVVLLLAIAPAARAEKPPKLPVAFGKWSGPHASTFKSALRRGLAKTCVVVRPNKARVVIDGEVADQSGKLAVRVIVKSPKTDDVVESREYTFAKPTVSQGMANKMGREVGEIVQRAPE